MGPYQNARHVTMVIDLAIIISACIRVKLTVVINELSVMMINVTHVTVALSLPHRMSVRVCVK